MSRARCIIDVHGLAQGVGFRPFVHGLAVRFELGGFVCNSAGAVHIEVEGEAASIDSFVDAVRTTPPPAARILRVDRRDDVPRGEHAFRIVTSDPDGASEVVVPADLATCEACLRELADVRDRRHAHPFVNCTQCGPRATIVTSVPYDRERTTMESFAMCEACRREYENPDDRRFHAQPIACPDCGPTLSLLTPSRHPIPSPHPIRDFAAVIREGGIGALKGIGGFHLVCDATNEEAVATLRRRKRRPTKAFAVMVGSIELASTLAEIDAVGREALLSSARPIVLLPRAPSAAIAGNVAPDVSTIGLLLPYSPLHHLLLEALEWMPVVMTSGNLTDEPIAVTDDEAFHLLGDVADVFLTHDRPIHLRAEDSVVRVSGGVVSPLRRSRGFAPLPIELPFDVDAPTLAVGGHQKAVFALAHGRRAILGPHFGDLDGLRAYESFRDSVAAFESLFRVKPTRVAHDLHPDHATSRLAWERVLLDPTVTLVGVQHHHAHLASCMADNGLDGTVLGICFDGMGLGRDGTAWGGEFLVGGYAGFERAAHLACVRLPGGDRAARTPWMSALAHLHASGLGSAALAAELDPRELLRFEKVLASGFEASRTTSMGRLFDAVAALAGVVLESRHEGEPGQRLEALAEGERCEATYPFALDPGSPRIIDTAPLVRAIVEDVRRGVATRTIARRFHSTIVAFVAAAANAIRESHAVARVVLGGGVFANAILSREIPRRLASEGFEVFVHRNVPANDGGLCLGQIAVAAHVERARTVPKPAPAHVVEGSV